MDQRQKRPPSCGLFSLVLREYTKAQAFFAAGYACDRVSARYFAENAFEDTMTTKVASCLATLLVTAAPAMALDFGNGFSLTGDVELEYYQTNSSDQSLAFADMTLSWRGLRL
jgi:hypothetical protein